MPKRKTVPRFSSYEEAAEWLGTHSTADIKTTPAHFELSPNFRVRIIDSLDEVKEVIAIEQPLGQQILQIAQKQGVSTETLVNRWLKEKVSEQQRLVAV